ncbi:MAG: spore cortex biosynthesis protein YabQ [Alicyclobacillus sp.]|nr:spore cortex biosynthesis protein YabQ [Alicyclobacillus sp.]
MQFAYIAGMCACAWAMGACFDVYNTVTGSSKWLRWLRPVLDIAFWLASAACVYFVVYRTNHGQLRAYTFPLLAGGYALYAALLHRRVVASAFAFVRFWGAVFRWLYRVLDVVLLRPLRWLFRFVWFLLYQLYRLLCLAEDGLFWVIRFWTGLLSVPFRPVWAKAEPLRTRWRAGWEGIWAWASNVLRRS